MAITRARKAPAKASKAERSELTPDEFIAGADKASPPARKPQPAVEESRPQQAQAIVRRYMPWAAGAGVLPMPGIDLAAITAVQVRMLARLSALYGVPFREEAGKSAIGALLSTLVQYTFSGHIAWAMKAVPVAGPLLGIAVLPAFAAATTYALGRVFITHFESGGTFLEFDPKQVEEHFRAEFDKARSRLPGSSRAAAA